MSYLRQMDWFLDQHWLFTWPGMIAWSVAVVLLTRIAAASFFKHFLRFNQPYLAAYLTFPALFAIGIAIVGMTGMPMYGFNSENWAHWVGYLTLFFSPLGLPLFLGAPMVLIADLLRRPWKTAPSEPA